MSIRRFDDFEAGVDEFVESQEVASPSNIATKLERRRRIEELEEERRLREELCEY